MIVAERHRTGSHKWENDWCPKCKERMTFWFVSETRTRCAMCATEKDKARGLGLGPMMDEAPAAAAPVVEPVPVPVPVPAPVPVVPAPIVVEEKPPQEPVWILSWCGVCKNNASFLHERRETFRCMACGITKELRGMEPGADGK